MTDQTNQIKRERTFADSCLIEWLLHDSGLSRYHISREVGMSESTLSRIASGHTPMGAVKFGSAHILTAYARRVQNGDALHEGGSAYESKEL